MDLKSWEEVRKAIEDEHQEILLYYKDEEEWWVSSTEKKKASYLHVLKTLTHKCFQQHKNYLTMGLLMVSLLLKELMTFIKNIVRPTIKLS